MYCSTYPRADHYSLLLASRSLVALAMSAGVATARDDRGDHRRFFDHGSLVISSSTYDPTKGAVASLMVGTPLPDTATTTIRAVSDNNYVTVWNNASVDGSFGVTSPIQLTDVDAFNGRIRHSLAVPTDQVVTSFSSKSELGLHFIRDWRGPHLIFVAYAGAGVGALDVSNSDVVAGQDPTNPVTFAFGKHYAFHRTIVSMDD
jgi:polygalacturonase